jgi:hypothetical protein
LCEPGRNHYERKKGKGSREVGRTTQVRDIEKGEEDGEINPKGRDGSEFEGRDRSEWHIHKACF